ncbi:NADP-dependent oxidoreductase [Salicibibacter kimchii]|uniref:NADP-dependent oxidoreductase n=1 Tax=Salicibibacter kimchii TaxID=2099786 RepID=A0A345BWL1_9BACI|nr:NADP-dependent oxidoreductase [Salicibibacter kimchii]AXF55342.1 NADP-dependent oxidoreductase [Salicibibacter kimchii]
MLNRQIHLVSRPQGLPEENNFKLFETHMPKPEEGQVLVQCLYLSVDPAMRGMMRDIKSYVPPYQLNEVLTGEVIGRVSESKHSNFAPGDFVVGRLGWEDYSVCNGENLRKIDPNPAPITTHLGTLGVPGLTAYFGLLDIGKPQPDETVVVSGAAGAVGMVVGQIAKLKGCRVVGIAGSDKKTQYLINELGFDTAINYKTTENVKSTLKEACPNGVDVYFDNVGGDITDSVIKLINQEARIVLCGQIALYNLEKRDVGPRLFPVILTKRAMIKGFIIHDYEARYQEAITQLSEWIGQGKILYNENIVNGLESAPNAFKGLFKGENLGKQLVKIAD